MTIDYTAKLELAEAKEQLKQAIGNINRGQVSETLARTVARNAQHDTIGAIKALAKLQGKISIRETENPLRGLGKIGAAERLQIVTSVLENDFDEPRHVLTDVLSRCGEEITQAMGIIAASGHEKSAELIGIAGERHPVHLEAASDLLVAMATPAAAKALLNMAPTTGRYDEVYASLKKIGTPEAAEALAESALERKVEIGKAIEVLAEFPGHMGINALQMIGQDSAYGILVIDALEKMGGDAAVVCIAQVKIRSDEGAFRALNALFNLRAASVAEGRNDLSRHDEALREMLAKHCTDVEQIVARSAPEKLSRYQQAFAQADALKLTPEPYTGLLDEAVDVKARQEALRHRIARFKSQSLDA